MTTSPIKTTTPSMTDKIEYEHMYGYDIDD